MKKILFITGKMAEKGLKTVIHSIEDKNFTYERYLKFLLDIWTECERILKPNGKLAINTPILPIPQDIIKQDTRHIKNINNVL